MSNDFENMPEDELVAFINSGGDPSVLEKKEEVLEEKVEEEKEEELNQDIEEGASEDSEEAEATEDQEEETLEPLLKKEKEELAKIIKDQQYYEARRGQELGNLRAEVAALKTAKAEESLKELDEDVQDNIAVVEEALTHIRKKEALQKEREQNELAAHNFSINLKAFEKLKENTDLPEYIRDELDSRFDALGSSQEERVRVMSQNPDWVTSNVLNILSSEVASKERAVKDAAEAKDNVAKRKAKASTNVGATAKAKLNKSVEEMSFEEYEEYFKNNFPQK